MGPRDPSVSREHFDVGNVPRGTYVKVSARVSLTPRSRVIPIYKDGDVYEDDDGDVYEDDDCLYKDVALFHVEQC
jgi:hypothetical protein